MKFVPDFLSKRARLAPNDVALEEFKSSKKSSFIDLENRANRLANHFSQNNVLHGDRISILCRNRIEFFEALFACAKIGAILVPLNWRSPAAELIPLMKRTTPKFILYGIEDKAVAHEIAMGAIKLGFDDNYNQIIDNTPPLKPRDFWPVDECWYLIFTSGTTGEPKAVIQTYGMALVNAINLGQAIDIRHDDVFVNFLPMFHTAGINLHTMVALINGAKSYILAGFDPNAVIDLIEKRQITTFFGVPQIYLQIAQHPKFATLRFDGMRHMGCGGAPLPDFLVHEFMNKGALICNGMGMTETGPTVFLMDTKNVTRKIGSVGKPQILTIAKITDDEGQELAANCAGNLWFAGPGITPGYWQNFEANEAAFHKDASGIMWLKTGDIAKYDDEGYFYIVGRTKEMFISGGENVYPAEIENILANREDIIEVAVVAINDEKWGEVGVAFIISNNEINATELSDYCRQYLAAFKIPKYFIKVDEFARTAAGKVQKHLLKLPDFP